MTFCLRLRSRRTPTMSRLSISNSSQAPRRRDQLGGVDVLVGRLVGGALEVDARGADQLRDDDTLGAVDDEGALVGHEREVAHEDRLALDLTGVVVGELGRDVERRGVGEVLLLALLHGVLRVVEDRVLERERHRLGEVLDRRDLLEDLRSDRTSWRRPRRRRAVAGRRPASARCRPASRSCRSGGRGAWGTSSGSEIFAKEMRRVVTSGAARGQEVSFDRFARGWRRPTTNPATGQAGSI